MFIVGGYTHGFGSVGTLHVLSVKKFKKISIPSLGSFLSSEPNFTLRK
jgi:hypothetical protein